MMSRGVSRRSQKCIPDILSVILLLGLLMIAAATVVQMDAPSGNGPAFGLAIQDPTHPIADAGDDRAVVVGTLVELNGSASSDDVGVTNFTWVLAGDDSFVLYGETVRHRFVTVGTHVVTLNVSDADGNWDTDAVTIAVEPDTVPPVAEAGHSKHITINTRISLNGSGSQDNSGYITEFTWTFVYDGNDIVLNGSTVSFWFNKTGTYVVNLTVRDYSGLTASDNATIVVEAPPTWLERNLVGLVAAALIVGSAGWLLFWKLKRDRKLVTPSDIEKLGLLWERSRKVWSQYRKSRPGMIGLAMLVAFVAMGVFAPLAVRYDDPYDPFDLRWASINDVWAPPSGDYWFGTDSFGRDIWSLTFLGSRASLIVGFFASLISIVIGTSVGVGAGYFGRITDEALMRLTDFFLVIPWFPLMIVFMMLFGLTFTNVIIVIGITSWPSTARIVRSQVLSVKERAFVERARAVGSGSGRVIMKHILPNVFPLIFANTILLIANSIFSESFLDFFGLGDPTVISWGTMLEAAYESHAFEGFRWWAILPPGLSIILLIMAFYLIGDALDEVLNPKLRRR